MGIVWLKRGVKRLFFNLTLIPRDFLLLLITSTYPLFVWVFTWLPPKYTAWAGKTRAHRAYYNALHTVPAYRKYIGEKDMPFEEAPETDKESYIKKFPTELRCRGGIFPEKDVMIDESSGSTGTPYNWIRNIKEREQSHKFVSFFSTFCYGEKPWITINAFSMGAWATGLNMGISLQQNGIVKNTGPDIGKIFNTLKFFGNKYQYLICGYPPFLKELVDASKIQRFPLKKFKLNALCGGEGMSEGLRDYLLEAFDLVYSGYGATDLEIGIAGETPQSVAIRQLANKNPKIRKKLFGTDSRLPMVFQYNPLMHYIETNKQDELLFTINRSAVLSPRIRYNIHDKGGIARYDEMKEKLKGVGIDIDKLTKGERMNFPFLWIYGRIDYTISVMGANIYPEDLEHCIYSDKRLSRITKSFCQGLDEGKHGSVRPAFYFEITKKPTKKLKELFKQSVIKHLIELNADFREAWRENKKTLVPNIYLYPTGQGPFKAHTGQIKQVRIVK